MRFHQDGRDDLPDQRSLVRVVHREQVVALSGARALLMQAAHPVAFEGFLAQTASLSEPYERLAPLANSRARPAFGVALVSTKHTPTQPVYARGVRAIALWVGGRGRLGRNRGSPSPHATLADFRDAAFSADNRG